jgi:uncharacterized membrane protein
MDLDVAVVRFDGQNGAVSAFAAMRDRSHPEARWIHEIGFVERHHNGHILLRGTFAGHYVDFDESDHVSESGAGKGAVIGGLLGAVLGPAGIASGIAIGGTIGSETGRRSDVEIEPELLLDRLRAAVPRASSAIVLFASADDVDAMLAALPDDHAETARETLTSAQTSALQESLASTPPASPGPSEAGEAGSR